MPKLLAVGELLIDLTPAGALPDGRMQLVRNPGGAPANVAVQAARLGVESAFLGKVGDDVFGRFLRDTLRENRVDTRGLVLDPAFLTTLAVVQLDSRGDRSFSFYRRKGADTQLRADEICMPVLEECDLLHYGSLLFTDEPSRGTTYALLEKARAMGKLLSYDPNWRPFLWKDREKGIAEMRAGLSYADILKVSQEEMTLLTEETDLLRGLQKLHGAGPAVIALTQGENGCVVSCKEGSRHCPTYRTAVVDTTGAGDSFFGAFLAQILLEGKAPQALSLDELQKMAAYANAAGALCAAGMGAIPSLPDDAAVRACMEKVPLFD